MPTQDNRPISITTPFGKDKLLLRSFQYKEAMNEDFEIDAMLVAEDTKLAFDNIVGKPVTIRVDLEQASAKRFLHGIVASFSQAGRESGLANYCAKIVPWFTFLNRNKDCRIFQKKSVPDIVAEVLKSHGMSDFKLELSETYPPIENCVQYRESAWVFISRLLEKVGIAYYYKHEENLHSLIFTDSISKHKPFPGYEKITYRESATALGKVTAITDWQISKQALTAAYAHKDFDFKRPRTDLTDSSEISRGHGMASFEVFDYPGEYVEEAEGKHLSKVHIEELQSRHESVNAQSNARGISVGCIFTLQDHPRSDQNREYMITAVSFAFDAGPLAADHGGSADQGLPEPFSCSLEAIPTTQPYRPARKNRKQLITGPQTAIITGPAGEEIHVDEHGRVKVQFHWDRYGKNDADSSCWIRVSQLWAGKAWGAMHIPRIGQEVIVEFLEGDPDRPIITGRVYNGEAKPPYALPANKNISTVKSNSTKGGGGFNEVKMDDTKGKELLYIQAEKDRTVLVKNDNSETVKHDETIEIGNDRKVKIAKNETVNIGENDTVEIGKKLSVNVGEEISFVCGAASITMKIDGKIEITGVDVTVKSGGGKVNIDAGGIITVKGPMVKIN